MQLRSSLRARRPLTLLGRPARLLAGAAVVALSATGAGVVHHSSGASLRPAWLSASAATSAGDLAGRGDGSATSRSAWRAQVDLAQVAQADARSAVDDLAQRRETAVDQQAAAIAAARAQAAQVAADQAAAAAAAQAEAERVAAAQAAAAARAAQVAAAVADPKGAAAAMAAARGWGGSQFSCLNSLWTRESGWNYRATNASSGAYGIPQSLPAAKMATAGADWATNPATQIAWGLAYIARSYGTPCGAWAHSQATGWY